MKIPRRFALVCAFVSTASLVCAADDYPPHPDSLVQAGVPPDYFSTTGQLMLGELFADALVPEPASMTLLLAGGAAMLGRRRRRN